MDARIEKTKRKIKDALFAILEKKAIADVTISEICQKAKVNRNTFYAHYATPEKVLEEIANEYISEEYKVLNACTTTKETVIAACEYTKRHAAENSILLTNTPEELFIGKAIDYSLASPVYLIDNNGEDLSPKQIKMIHTYIVNGAVAIIKEWLYSGMKESPEEIGETVDYITTSLIKGIHQTLTI